MQHHPYSHARTIRGETDTTTLPLCFIARVLLSQYSEQLLQEMDSSENTFYVLEPHSSRLLRPQPFYSCRHGAHSQLYHPVSLRNTPCAFAMFLSYSTRPQLVSLRTLLLTSAQSLTCPFRPQMQFTDQSPSVQTQFKEKYDAVTVQTQRMEEKMDQTLSSSSSRSWRRVA